jgi:hypothetical protein
MSPNSGAKPEFSSKTDTTIVDPKARKIVSLVVRDSHLPVSVSEALGDPDCSVGATQSSPRTFVKTVDPQELEVAINFPRKIVGSLLSARAHG